MSCLFDYCIKILNSISVEGGISLPLQLPFFNVFLSKDTFI